MTETDSTERDAPPIYSLALYSLLAGTMLGIAALSVFLFVDRLRGEELARRLDQVRQAEIFDGSAVINPPIKVPDFRLSNAAGQPTRLSDFQGSYSLLTFGFTHCPDVCPLTLNDFKRIQAQMDELASELRLVFISVDGARDTPAALREYFALHELDGIIALTGREDDVRAYGQPFGLTFEVSAEVVAGGYTVNHTAGSFLLDRDGRWIMRYHFGVPPESIVADLRGLIEAES